MKIKSLASSFIPKIIFMKRSFGKNTFSLLDIGAGNHSASKITSVFPSCRYYGLDVDKNYNNDETDFGLMSGFFELDLTKLDFSSIPDNYFDGIWMAHVIEHLFNGDQVIKALLPKLVKGGYLYIEYPGRKSLNLPSMYGTLNFHDDPTHVRLYSVMELKELFNSNGCSVIKSGTRRNIWFIFAMPFRIILSLLRGKKMTGNIFWDILGFAEFLYIRKN